MRKIVVKIFGKYSDAYYLYTIIKNKNKMVVSSVAIQPTRTTTARSILMKCMINGMVH